MVASLQEEHNDFLLYSLCFIDLLRRQTLAAGRNRKEKFLASKYV